MLSGTRVPSLEIAKLRTTSASLNFVGEVSNSAATANLRGGGEYGEEWHQQGNLTRKQYVFDDIIACAQYLVDQKYSSPAHLAISGGAMADC